MAKAKGRLPELEDFNVKLNDGRRLSFFVNKKTNLVVVDVLEKDGIGGNEFVRTYIPPPFTQEQREQCLQVAAQED